MRKSVAMPAETPASSPTRCVLPRCPCGRVASAIAPRANAASPALRAWHRVSSDLGAHPPLEPRARRPQASQQQLHAPQERSLRRHPTPVLPPDMTWGGAWLGRRSSLFLSTEKPPSDVAPGPWGSGVKTPLLKEQTALPSFCPTPRNIGTSVPVGRE